MKNIAIFLLIMGIVSACSAPKPPKISFTRNMKPINFDDGITDNNTVIKSSQTQNCWSKRFVYSIDKSHEHSPQFFYAIAHADKITVLIKPPFVGFVFSKVQSDLRSYGVTAPIELLIGEDSNQNYQVILECTKYCSPKSLKGY